METVWIISPAQLKIQAVRKLANRLQITEVITVCHNYFEVSYENKIKFQVLWN